MKVKCRPVPTSQLVLNDALSVRYNVRVLELKERGLSPIMLSLGEAFFNFDERFALNSFTNQQVHYTHSRGTAKLRADISSYYASRYGVTADPGKQVLISAGSKILTFMTFKNFVSYGARRQVLIPQPAWVSYSEQVALAGGKVKFIAPTLEVSSISRAVDAKTKMVVICNPHNPTGKNYSSSELEKIFRLAEERELVVLSDEAYSEFLPANERFVSMGAIDKNLRRTVIVNSFSKNFGVSGWRLGYALSNEDTITNLYKINQHLVTCAPSLLEYFVAEKFELFSANASDQIRDLMQKRADVTQLLRKMSIECMPGTSTFYFFLKIPSVEGGSVAYADRLLEDYQVAVVPGIGYGPDCDEFVRLSIGAEPLDRIVLGIEAIGKMNAKIRGLGSA